MPEGYSLSRGDLQSYLQKKERVAELTQNISVAKEQLAEVERYMESISAVLTGMPNGNAKRDKVADIVVKMTNDRTRFTNILHRHVEEQETLRYQLTVTRIAVLGIADERLRKIIEWHFLEGVDVTRMASKPYEGDDGVVRTLGLSVRGVRQKLQRYLKSLAYNNVKP